MSMEVVASTLWVIATVVLGVSAGALVAEGAVLVPFWRSLEPEAFLGWYQEHAGLLLKFFGPLEITAAVLALAALALNWLHGSAASDPLMVSAVLAVAVLAAFPLYFQKVNARFASGAVARDCVQDELRRWSRWHWARTVLAVGAFVSAVVSLLGAGCQLISGGPG